MDAKKDALSLRVRRFDGTVGWPCGCLHQWTPDWCDTSDRNGLRPARYYVTSDDRVMMASKWVSCLRRKIKITEKRRLQPGKMLLIDLEQGRIIEDNEIKEELASAQPYQDWLNQAQIKLSELPEEYCTCPCRFACAGFRFG